MTTDDLTERIARALARQDGYDPDKHCDEWIMYGMRESAAAVLPIIAAEVRAAKAEALREAADGLLENIDWSDGRSNYGDNEGYEASARELRASATEYETGDQT